MTRPAVHDAATPADQHGWESPPGRNHGADFTALNIFWIVFVSLFFLLAAAALLLPAPEA